MITAQDIREKTFEKSKFGGYDMAEVDDFLEELAASLTESQKESSVLKSKMKVLVDKIEEYRSNESALNQSILSAQKLAQQIEAEAREKADKMVSDAEAKVRETLGNITDQKEFEEKRLAAAQAASAKFIDGIRAMCNAQLKNIDNISAKTAAPVTEAPKAVAETRPVIDDVEDAVRNIEASVSRIKPEPAVQLDLSADMDADYAPAGENDSTQPFSF